MKRGFYLFFSFGAISLVPTPNLESVECEEDSRRMSALNDAVNELEARLTGGNFDFSKTKLRTLNSEEFVEFLFSGAEIRDQQSFEMGSFGASVNLPMKLESPEMDEERKLSMVLLLHVTFHFVTQTQTIPTLIGRYLLSIYTMYVLCNVTMIQCTYYRPTRQTSRLLPSILVLCSWYLKTIKSRCSNRARYRIGRISVTVDISRESKIVGNRLVTFRISYYIAIVIKRGLTIYDCADNMTRYCRESLNVMMCLTNIAKLKCRVRVPNNKNVGHSYNSFSSKSCEFLQ